MLTAYVVWVLALTWVCVGRVIPSQSTSKEANPTYSHGNEESTTELRPLVWAHHIHPREFTQDLDELG